ncbi:putative pleckstrin [Trypoxylus dichotomus]
MKYARMEFEFEQPKCRLEARILELHSPDAVHSCVLRACDPSEAAAWFNTLHSALAVLTTAALHEASRAIPDLRHIGWLLRRPRLEALMYEIGPIEWDFARNALSVVAAEKKIRAY